MGVFWQYTRNEFRVLVYLWWVGATFAKWALSVHVECRWVLLVGGGGGGGGLRGALRECRMCPVPAPVLIGGGCDACGEGGGGR